MKIKHLISASCFAFLAGALFSCSSEDVAENNGQSDKVQENYITVSIAGNEGTRSFPDGYLEGTENERMIKTVRFYFFKDNGEPINVKAPGFDKNFYTFTKISTGWKDDRGNNANGGGQDDASVEEQGTTISTIFKSTIVISTKDGDRLPARMMAVVNYQEAGLDETSKSITDLQTALYNNSRFDNVAASTSGLGEGDFLMTNSVYVSNKGLEVSTLIPATSICAKPDLAKANPVNIYVERTVARVTPALTLAPTETVGSIKLYYTKRYLQNSGSGSYLIKTEDDITKVPADCTPIYVKFLGWNMTAVTSQGYLVKKVNSTWKNTDIFGSDATPWNTADYHRSFWGINPAGTTVKYGDFDDAKLSTKFTIADGASPRYLMPNAATNDDGSYDNERTKIIIAAQLCKADGTPFYMSSWIGQTYIATDEDQNELNLKTAMAEILKDHIYKKVGSTGKTIEPSDIILKTEDASASAPTSETRRYTVWAEVATGTTWYSDLACTTPFTYSGLTGVEAVNKYMSELLPAKIWNTGYTYYYFDIKHIGESGSAGEYGVVRNHAYTWDVNSLSGLGTPVYDPDEEIIPEKTEDQESYIAAKINILAWRLVSQAIDLTW